MHLRENPDTGKPFQLIDFVSLKKKNTQKYAIITESKITFSPDHQSLTIPMILAFYQFTSRAQINQNIFIGFKLDLFPKQYQSYAHEKTLKALLEVIKNNSESQNTLVSLLDQFPIISFVLDAYSRAICRNFIQTKKDLLIQGNEQEILENFSMEVRGDLLNIMTHALGIHLTLICGDFIQNYGLQTHKRKVIIWYRANSIEAELISPKQNSPPLHYIRTNESSGTKTLKQLNSMETETSQNQQFSSIDGSSMLKNSVTSLQLDRCEKCKFTIHKCLCIKKTVLNYTNPKTVNSNQKSPKINPNSNIFALLNHSKCTCHKLLCVCRK